jgi:hypothetical protein
MKVITEGYKYELPGFEDLKNIQLIQFIEKVPSETSDELITVNDGTTNEDLISVLINRLSYLQSKFPCEENARSLECLNESLYWLHKRTEDREKRKVEGKHIK